MNISELITALEEIRSNHGEVNVVLAKCQESSAESVSEVLLFYEQAPLIRTPLQDAPRQRQDSILTPFGPEMV